MKRCVDLLIQNSQGEYLLQMRDDTPNIVCPLTWNMFGGGIEHSEEPADAAARELQEELGIKTSPDEFALETMIVVGGIEKYFMRFSRPLEWGNFKVFEGAGAGFFTIREIEKISTTSTIKAYFESMRPQT